MIFSYAKNICAENGNYVILNVILETTRVTLENIYDPNRDNPDFDKAIVRMADT